MLASTNSTEGTTKTSQHTPLVSRRRGRNSASLNQLHRRNQLKQVSTFLHCLEEEAETVLASINSTEEKVTCDLVIADFDGIFDVRKKVIFKRAQFDRRFQFSEKPVETYIIELYKLAVKCDFITLKTEMIRDRLMVEIKDGILS